jgi:hypothetical protein
VQLVGGSSDPYVVANIGESSGETPVVWGTTSPVWDATFPLYVRCVEADVLRLRVFDKNNLLADKDLGAAMVKVSALLEAGGQPLTLPLRGGWVGWVVRGAGDRGRGARLQCMRGAAGTSWAHSHLLVCV